MKYKLCLWGLMLFCLCWFCLGIYGGCQLYTRSDHNQQLSDYRFEINHLQTQIFHLRELNDYVPILEQILNSQQLAELKALSEMIRQQKHKNYERYEQPILNEKEKRR